MVLRWGVKIMFFTRVWAVGAWVRQRPQAETIRICVVRVLMKQFRAAPQFEPGWKPYTLEPKPTL